MSERFKIGVEGRWIKGGKIVYQCGGPVSCDGFLSIDRSAMGHRSAAGRLSVLDFEKVAVCIGGMVVKT